MKRKWFIVMVIFGFIVIFFGFVYDVLFAGIPYQDPTPALEARYQLHSNIAAIIRWVGLGISVTGGCLIIFQKISK